MNLRESELIPSPSVSTSARYLINEGNRREKKAINLSEHSEDFGITE
jgi:hypothetical protein